jgi:hypothetical protein
LLSTARHRLPCTCRCPSAQGSSRPSLAAADP